MRLFIMSDVLVGTGAIHRSFSVSDLCSGLMLGSGYSFLNGYANARKMPNRNSRVVFNAVANSIGKHGTRTANLSAVLCMPPPSMLSFSPPSILCFALACILQQILATSYLAAWSSPTNTYFAFADE